MAETNVKGLNHIAPTQIKNPDLQKITTSPFARSETRYMTPVTMNFRDVNSFKTDSIILCDSPGFEDTNGAEIDIANGFGIITAVKGCHGVKPVVVISYKSIGDRCEGIKSLARMLVGIIPDIKDHIKSFSYIFTKFPPRERNSIHALLVDINKNLSAEEKSNSSFTIFLNDMLKKTNSRARALDPMHDSPKEILEELAGSPSILHPDEVFKLFITEKSKIILQEQARKIRSSIMLATKRFEYLFVQYKLDQLKGLETLTQQQYIIEVYNECIQYITDHLVKEYEQGTSALDICLMHEKVLSTEDIEKYQRHMNHAESADNLRDSHLGKEVVCSSAFIQYLNKRVDTLLTDIKKKDINELIVKENLDKLKLLSEFFPTVNDTYANTCKILSDKINRVVNSFKSTVLLHKFLESANEMTKIHESLGILPDHFSLNDLKATYDELKEYFLNYLKDYVTKLDHIFCQEKMTKNDIDSLNTCVCMIEDVCNATVLLEHISKNTLNVIYEDFYPKF
ncbi:unnamed protein product [Rotaria sp. Silwood1]|nr:unnamed protein product [Rotaria sp. Silwood1]